MEKQQTAVEWLEELLILDEFVVNYNKFMIEKAKQIEKEQITNAFEDGKDSFSTRNAEQYYNETFKNK
jgi:hypothetical protein